MGCAGCDSGGELVEAAIAAAVDQLTDLTDCGGLSLSFWQRRRS